MGLFRSRESGRQTRMRPARGLGRKSRRRHLTNMPTSSYHLDHLEYLETEAIHVMREVAGSFERPAILFSGGKDSICLLRLAEKAFRPSDIPMPLLNVETGHEFPELIDFRDRRAKQLGAKLIVSTVDKAIANGSAVVT